MIILLAIATFVLRMATGLFASTIFFTLLFAIIKALKK